MTHESPDKKPKKEQPEKGQQPKRQQAGDQGNGKGLEGEAQRHIGRMLKATYDEIAQEPIPDKFRALLDQLGASDTGKR